MKTLTRSIAIVAIACATSQPLRADAIDALAAAIEGRLSLMDDVARYKWNHALPVGDRARETALVERTTAAAVGLGVPQAYARRVMAAQIAASRARQEALMAGWRRSHAPTFADVPDLADVQRPAIDRATDELLGRLRAAVCELGAAERTRVASAPARFADTPGVWAIAVEPLWPAPACASTPATE